MASLPPAEELVVGIKFAMCAPAPPSLQAQHRLKPEQYHTSAISSRCKLEHSSSTVLARTETHGAI